MSDELVVVGSGPSGVHFARTALDLGRRVTMLDVGTEHPPPVLPDAAFGELKQRLDDPIRYLLGDDFASVTLPGGAGEYYGLPPSKAAVLAPFAGHAIQQHGFASLSSFARGGLAEAWTAGVYPFNDAELKDFPIDFADLKPHYEEVARRIGICGLDDDLSRFFPLHQHIMEPLRLDDHSRHLLQRYEDRKDALNAAGCYAGRSRLAVLSHDHDGRGACTYLGRCLWGCPRGSLYTPTVTLTALLAHPSFTYRPNSFVSHLAWDRTRRLSGVVVVRGGQEETISATSVALAAGALSSARIVLESIRRESGETLVLSGLMDNQQILVPFVNPGMLGRTVDPRSYQYHQVCLGLADADPRHYIHAQITTLKTAMAHPVIQSLPFDAATSLRVFRLLRNTLGVANVNLHDTRRPDCAATLETRDGRSVLLLQYTPARDDEQQIAAATSRVRSALRKLGCVMPPGMSHVRPKGASVHYAGLIPMGAKDAPLTASADGKSNDINGLWFADGVTFPFLPAKNITFTLMANAVRVARAAC